MNFSDCCTKNLNFEITRDMQKSIQYRGHKPLEKRQRLLPKFAKVGWYFHNKAFVNVY